MSLVPSKPSPIPGSSSSTAPARSKNGLTASSVAIASNVPLSARVAQPLDLDSVPRRVAGSKEPPARTHIHGIQEAPTYRPTEEQWRDPLEYIQSIAPEGKQYGIVKIIPPDNWNPDFAIDTTRFHFRTRKQELNSCEGGTRANLDYLDQLSKFHKSQGMNLNRFPSVDKRPLDLYELKKAVESRGGFDWVCKTKKWAEVGRVLGYSGKIMSSLSTSLKNSYAKWLDPYERYIAGAKPAVQWQIEQERGGPYNTPSPGTSPGKRWPSQQHTPSSLGKISPVVRASDALNDAMEEDVHTHELSSRPPKTAPAGSSSGFTPINSGGFTAINKPTSGFAPINMSSGFSLPPESGFGLPREPPRESGFALSDSSGFSLPRESGFALPQDGGFSHPRGFPRDNEYQYHKDTHQPPAHSQHGTNGYSVHQPLLHQPQPMYAPHDLKRSYSDMSNDASPMHAEEKSGKRPKRESGPPTVAGSYMNSRPSSQKPVSAKEKNNWGPGDYCEICSRGDDDNNILLCESCHNGYHTYCLDPPLNSVPDYDWHCPKCLVGTGEFGFEEGGTYSLKQFQERAFFFREHHFKNKQPFDPISDGPKPISEDDVEREFWRLVSSLTETVEVEYGADIHSTTHGSGFPTIESDPRNPYSIDPWNLNILPLWGNSLFRYTKSDISGMTVPWLYVGMVFSTFCWHNEDHYAYSANYQHFGDTKTWYGIPSEDAEKFEAAMRDAVPDLFEKQPDLLFQLVTLLQPEHLKKAGVRVYAVDQRAGQLVVTFPQAYHAGFNHGFNFNEAVNFAPPDWEPFGENGAERLRDFRRQPAFSHDELLFTAASSKDISIETAKWLGQALHRMLHREKTIRQAFEALVQDKHKYKPRPDSDFHFLFERETDKEDLPEDSYICTYCKGFAYLSRFVCANSNKIACLDHIEAINCCENTTGHTVHIRIQTARLESIVQKVREKAELPEAWTEKFEATIAGTGKPQLKTLRTLLNEGERIPWNLPQLPHLKKFVDRCNEWVDEAQTYITRKQQNRRKNGKVWRKSGHAKVADGEEKDDVRKVEDLHRLLKEADSIGFECQEIATLQERADAIEQFQAGAREAFDDLEALTIGKAESLLVLGEGFPVEVPENEYLEKLLRQLRWKDRASDTSQPKALQEVEDLIKEAGAIKVPETNQYLLILQDSKLRGQMWENKARELLNVENVHFPQLDALSRQANDLPVSKDTLAKIDAVLKKQREASAEIDKLFRRTQNPKLEDRPLYAELNEVLKMIGELSSKPPGAIDIERQQRKHEDWMRKGKRLFGKSNAPLHILHQHLQYVRDRNKFCFDVDDMPRAPAEPNSREVTPETSQEDRSTRDVFCLCRRPESGMMIECAICHEWYHSKCLKIARGKVKGDDDFICPICDHTKRIPRDADRPKLEEMIEIQMEMPHLPFQPEEHDTIDEIVENAQAFRNHVQQYMQSSAVITLEEMPLIRFYLRKIEGADVLLAEETNFFKQELHRLLPIAPVAPKQQIISKSTRKPRPTKLQKLLTQHKVERPEDLPPDAQTKIPKKRASQHHFNGPVTFGVADSSRRTSTTTQSGDNTSKSGHRASGQANGSSGSINFRTPLTAGSFPQHQQQDNRVRPESPMFNTGASLILNGPPSATTAPLGSPFGTTAGSPTSPANQSTNIFESGSPAGLAALAGQVQAFGDQPDGSDGVQNQPGFLDVDDPPPADSTMFDSSPTGPQTGEADGEVSQLAGDSFRENLFADYNNPGDGDDTANGANVPGGGGSTVDPALLA